VVARNGEPVVEVIENGRTKLQPVKIGPTSECEVVVESGISEGAVVSLNPQMPAAAEKQVSGQN
jgi:hypothetical protein